MTTGSQETSEPLRRHAAQLQALRAAEREYHRVLRAQANARAPAGHALQRCNDEALERLAEAVVALQDGLDELRPSAGPQSSVAPAATDEPVAVTLAGHEYPGYLAARTYDEVRAEAQRRLRTRQPASTGRSASSP